jgi:hypothetical protein
MKTVFRVLLTLALSGLLVSDVIADSYRCGRKLVRSGDSPVRLVQLCGEPRFRDSGTESFEREGKRIETRVQRWYYKKSRRSLERIVLIYRGEIVDIRVGDR